MLNFMHMAHSIKKVWHPCSLHWQDSFTDWWIWHCWLWKSFCSHLQAVLGQCLVYLSHQHLKKTSTFPFTAHTPAHYFSSDSHRLPKAREPYGTIRDPCALASQCVSVLERENSRGSRCQQAGWFKFNRNRADICMAGPVSPLLLSLLTHRHTQSVFIVTSHRHHHTQQQQQLPVRRRTSSTSSSLSLIRPPGLY